MHGGDLSDTHIASVISRMGLSSEHMHLLREYISADSLLVPHGASPWAAAVVKEFQSDSWMTVGRGLAVAEAGTRPGDSLADIIFSFLFTAVLRQVRKALLHAGFDVRLPWSEGWYRNLLAEGEPETDLAPIDVSWMDDLALLLSANSPGELIRSAERSASLLIDECIKALLHPNLDPGKSEALLSLVGRDSRKVRADLIGQLTHPLLCLPLFGRLPAFAWYPAISIWVAFCTAQDPSGRRSGRDVGKLGRPFGSTDDWYSFLPLLRTGKKLCYSTRSSCPAFCMGLELGQLKQGRLLTRSRAHLCQWPGKCCGLPLLSRLPAPRCSQNSCSCQDPVGKGAFSRRAIAAFRCGCKGRSSGYLGHCASWGYLEFCYSQFH